MGKLVKPTSQPLIYVFLSWYQNPMLGSKSLGTNVLELQFVICWQTMIKTSDDSRNFFQIYCCLVISLIYLSFINYNLLYCYYINYKIINCYLA